MGEGERQHRWASKPRPPTFGDESGLKRVISATSRPAARRRPTPYRPGPSPKPFLSGSQVCTNEVRENERGRYGVGAQVFAPALLTVSRGTRLVSEAATPPDPASARRSTSGYRWASQRIGPGTVGQVPRG